MYIYFNMFILYIVPGILRNSDCSSEPLALAGKNWIRVAPNRSEPKEDKSLGSIVTGIYEIIKHNQRTGNHYVP